MRPLRVNAPVLLLVLLALASGLAMAWLYHGAHESLGKLKLSPLDNNTWAAVQTQLEYERLRGLLRRVELGDPDATPESLALRLDIMHSRLGVLAGGDVRTALERLPSYTEVLATLHATMAEADTITNPAQSLPFSEASRRIDALLAPLDTMIKRFTVEVVQSSAALRGRHEEDLSEVLDALRWASLIIGLAFLATAAVLAVQNRRLAASDRDSRRMLVELTEANAAKSRFLANMSHELRTPLNAVIGFSDLMRQEMLGPLPPRYAGYVRDIHASGQHLLGLVEDVLDMARIDAGHVDIQMAWFPLAEIVGSATLVVKPQAELAKVSLTVLPVPAVEAHVDSRAARQILVNLLSNAVKFTPAAGSVSCRVGTDPRGDLVIDVDDTGIGIPPEDVSKVTQPFHRGANATAAAVGGSGLGLAIVKTLIDLHGGRLELVSVLGRGTRARVTLPADRVRPQEPAPLRATA